MKFKILIIYSMHKEKNKKAMVILKNRIMR